MARWPARWKVWFHRSRAVVWAIVGALSFPLGWANSVALVWVASLYANVVTDIGAAEAADDRAVCDRLDRIERLLTEQARRQRATRSPRRTQGRTRRRRNPRSARR